MIFRRRRQQTLDRGRHCTTLHMFVMALAAAAYLAACSRQNTDTGACSVPAPVEPTKVNVISYPSPGMPFFGDQMAQCSHVAQLQVRHQMLPYDELVSQATIAMSSKSPSPYHIIHVYDALLVEWANRGWLAPLDDLVKKYWEQYRLAEIPDNVWDMMRVNGHIYAIPALQNVEIFFYRKDLFDKYGLKEPRTYHDLDALCQVLMTNGESKHPLVMMYSKMSHHFTYEFHDLIHSMGGAWFNEDGTPSFNSPTGIAALQEIVNLYRSCVNPNAVNFTPEDALIGLQQGQFLMAVLWMNEAPQMDDPSASKFAGKFGFSPAPGACADCPPAGSWAQDSWVIPANASVSRELLFQVAMEGVKTSNQSQAADLTLVTRPDVASAAESPYWAPGVISIERGAVGLERKPYAYLAIDAIERYGIEALLGHLTAQQALDRAATDFQRSMRDEGFSK